MISPRFAVPVAVLLALALIPTVIHSYYGARLDDGLRTSDISASLDGAGSSPTERRAAWVQNRFDTDDWIERTYGQGGTAVTLFAARSFDAKRLYHHPELAVLRGFQTSPAGVARAAARPDVPLHVLDIERDGRRGVAVYALLYDGRFIDNAVLFQLRTSVELLVSGRRPLTLIMASALAGSRDRLDEAPATGVLLAAIASFEAQAAVDAGR